MANTFHSVNEKERSSNVVDDISVLGPEDDSTGKFYLIHEPDIRDHPLWKGPGFWESALIEKASLELAFSPPVQWDELNPELLREAVLGNVVYSCRNASRLTTNFISFVYIIYCIRCP